MADTKMAKTGVARRSARTFESDIDIRQAEQFGADTGMSYNMQRNRSDVRAEHSQEREMEEKRRSTRSSSVSSTAVGDDDITSILGGLDKMAHERDGKGTPNSRVINVNSY